MDQKLGHFGKVFLQSMFIHIMQIISPWVKSLFTPHILIET